MAQSFKQNCNELLIIKSTMANIVPSLEAKATHGNPVFTPKQWLERFRQFCKREHNIDITSLLKSKSVTNTDWTGKELKKLNKKSIFWEWHPKH